MIGFGGEIVSTAPELTTIRRSLDREGTRFETVRIDGVGMRHRAANRLCARERDAFAIVISQASGLEFVAWHNEALSPGGV